jgi:hypothetical protein
VFDIFRRARYVCKLWNANIERSISSLDVKNILALPGPALVCQTNKWQNSKFLAHIKAQQLTGTLVASTASYVNGKDFSEELLSHFCHITTLNIRIPFPEGDPWGADHAIVRLPHLKKLQLLCNTWPFADDANEILMPKLDILKIEYDKEMVAHLWASKMTNLRKLHVTATPATEFASVIRQLPQLESLFIPELEEPEDDESKTLEPIVLPSKLVKLNVKCGRSGELPNLEPCASTLKRLALTGVDRVTHRIPPALELSEFCVDRSYPDLLQEFSHSLRNLKRFVQFGSTEHLNEENLKIISSISSLKLHYLHLGDSVDISKLPHLTALYAFTFDFDTLIMPPQMSPTLAATPLLRSLEIHLGVLSNFIQGLKGLPLETLLLNQVHEPINDEAWSTLITLQSLKVLKLKGRKAVSRSEADVVALCNACPNLTSLFVEEIVDNKNEEAMRAFSRRLRMEHILLDQCRIFTTPPGYYDY